MTGTELKSWVESVKLEHRKFAKEFGISVSTLYNWYHKDKPLPILVERAFKQFLKEFNPDCVGT